MESEYFDAKNWCLLPGAPQEIIDEFNYFEELSSYLHRPLNDAERERLNELLSNEKYSGKIVSITGYN